MIRRAVDARILERVSRGMYGLPGAEITEHHSLVQVAQRVPRARFCLLSALRFHHLTTQNPQEVWLAVGRGERSPKMETPALRVVRFSEALLDPGLEKHLIEGTTVQVYSVARTVVDLFRYRHKLGTDIAVEALREGWDGRHFKLAELHRLANLCRMSRVIKPYLESIVA